MSRWGISLWSWLSVYEPYYGTVSGTPTSDGTGSCSFDFGVDMISNISWAGFPTAPGNTVGRTLLGLNSVVVTDHASWADGEIRRLFNIAGNVHVYAKKSGSNWVVEAKDSEASPAVGTGSTLLTFGSTYHISASLRHFSSDRRIRVWVGSTQEISMLVGATSLNTNRITLGLNTGTANGSFAVREVYAAFTDTDERIDASALNGQKMALSGNGTYNEFAQADDGTPPSDPRHDSVDEDPPDGDTTWMQSGATTNTRYRQTYTTTNVTLANVDAVAVFNEGRCTVADKVIPIKAMSGDGTNFESVATQASTSTSYTQGRCIFERAPDAGVWTQTDLDALEVGTDLFIADDIVAWRDTAVHCEAMGCDYIDLTAIDAPRSRTYVW